MIYSLDSDLSGGSAIHLLNNWGQLIRDLASGRQVSDWLKITIGKTSNPPKDAGTHKIAGNWAQLCS